jgi:hypothetical protein
MMIGTNMETREMMTTNISRAFAGSRKKAPG